MWVEVLFDEIHLRGGDPYPGQEGESYPEFVPSEYHSVPKGIVFRELTGGGDIHYPPSHHFRVSDDLRTGYLVWQRYGDGDTFSSSSGHFHAIAVLDDLQEATDLKSYLREAGNQIGYPTEFRGIEYRVEGLGYFGSVQGFYVMEFPIEGIPASRPKVSPAGVPDRAGHRLSRLLGKGKPK